MAERCWKRPIAGFSASLAHGVLSRVLKTRGHQAQLSPEADMLILPQPRALSEDKGP